jgi:hypothetical protein
MEKLNRTVIAGLAAALFATACLGFAGGGSHKSSDRGVSVTFPAMTKFNNGAALPAGTYWMVVPKTSQTPEVTFYKENVQTSEAGGENMEVVGNKPLATVKAKLVAENAKNRYTTIDSTAQGDAQLVTAIHPNGWTEAIVFTSDGE